MSHWYEDNSLSIGRTPLVRLNRVTDGAKATVLAKIEGRNPAYSVKCRIGAAMIWDAEKRGLLGPGKEIVEPTSGNTGIALAFVAAARGYPITLTMPETMSIERRKLLVAYGAKLVLTEGAKGMKRRDRQGRGDRRLRSRTATCCCSSSRTPPIPASTRRPPARKSGTTPTGAIDIFVSGVGTGGTITGVSRYIKQTKGKPILRSRSSRPRARPDAEARRRAAQARAAQDPGHRRGLRARRARPLAGRRDRAGHQRGGDRFARRLAARGRHPLRHLLRRGGGGRGAPRQAAARTPARPSSSSCPIPASAT